MARPVFIACALSLTASAVSAEPAARFDDPPGATRAPAPVAPAPVQFSPPASPAYQAPVAPPASTPNYAPPGVRLASSDAPMVFQEPSFGYGAPPPAPADWPAEPQSSGSSTLTLAGGLMLGIPYATGLGVAAAESFDNGSGWLVVPAVGPWLALSGRRDPCAGLDDAPPQEKNVDSELGRCMTEPLIRGLLVLDGVLQATGAVIMIAGATSGGSKQPAPPAPYVAVSPAPVGSHGYGVGALGRF